MLARILHDGCRHAISAAVGRGAFPTRPVPVKIDPIVQSGALPAFRARLRRA
jgi:hypothetical protein